MKEVLNKILPYMAIYRNIIFVIILVLGSWYRLYYVTSTQEWFGDFGRDAIVAKHLVLYPETYNLAPLAAASAGTLNNTPVYYWLVAVIWFFTRSEIGLIYFFSLMGIITIYLSYVLSKKLFPGIYALVFPFFMAFSNLMIVTSRNVWQPYFLPPLFLLVLICLVNGFRGDKKYLLYSLELSFVATFIHLSFLPILFLNIIFLLIYSLSSKSKQLFGSLLFQIIINALIWISFTPITKVNTFKTIISNLIINRGGIDKFLYNMNTNIQILHQNILPMLSSSFFIILSILALINIYFSIKQHNSDKAFKLYLVVIVFSFLLLGGYHNKLSIHYFLTYYIYFLLTASLFIRSLASRSGLLAGICIGLVYVGISVDNPGIKNSKNITSEIEISNTFANEILSLSGSDNVLIDLCFRQNACYRDISDGGLWYSLERMTGKKLGYIGPGNESYYPIKDTNHPVKKYLICRYDLSKCLKNSGQTKETVTVLKEFINPQTTLLSINLP